MPGMLLFYYIILLHDSIARCMENVVLYCIVLYYVVLYCIILYHVVLYCVVLCCVVLCCIMLCCIVLCCVVLHCIVEGSRRWLCVVFWRRGSQSTSSMGRLISGAGFSLWLLPMRNWTSNTTNKNKLDKQKKSREEDMVGAVVVIQYLLVIIEKYTLIL